MLGGDRGCLGIDIGQKTIKIVQTRGKSGRYRINAWGILDKEQANIQKDRWRADMFEDIKLILQVNGLRRGRACVALPDNMVNVSYRKIPPMPKEELSNALRWEAGKDWNLAQDEMVLDFIPMGEVMEGTDTMLAYLVAVSRKSLLEDLCRRLSSLGIKVRSIEFSTMAQISCLLKTVETEGTIGMVDLGDYQTNLVVLKDGAPRFFRTIHTGGKNITDAISQVTGLSWWEAERLKETGEKREEISTALRGTLEGIVDEVFQTFRFYGVERREGGLDRVVITGGGGLMTGIDDFFQDILGIPSKILDPFSICAPAENLRETEKLLGKGPRMITALGLTMTE